jgi:hypothetical protein
MKVRLSLLSGVALAAAAIVGAGLALRADSPSDGAKKSKPRRRAGADAPADSMHRVPVAIARDRAAQMHATLESTLHAMHRHYFQRGRSTLPARALEDVFEDVARDAHVNVRWISVNTKPISVDREPETAFEKQAAKEIAAGKESFERVEKGTYHRAGAILLGAGCVNCHTTSFAAPPKTPRYAGLVISVPTVEE